MSTPRIGERYRGVDGRSGYLLRQAWQAFRGAMETALRADGLNGAQYAVLSVVARDPGMSGADLARACNTTTQAMNGVLATLERAGAIEATPAPDARPHPPSHADARRGAATSGGHPGVQGLEDAIEEDLAPDEIAAIKAWLVASAHHLHAQRHRARPPHHHTAARREIKPPWPEQGSPAA
jgi:MarR family